MQKSLSAYRHSRISPVDANATITALPHLHRPADLAKGCPLVSICITALNRERYIDAAVESALGQTYNPLDVVVVDDASMDGTVNRVLSHDDPRLRLYVNERTLGQNANRNRALELAHGELIKFLDSDDILEPDCVATMVQPFVEDPAVGLVFSRRRISVDKAAQPRQEWLTSMSELHTHFRDLQALNDGRALLAEMLSDGLRGNWIGEPSAVMVRRSHLELSGGFGYNLQLTVDFDLWTRLFSHARVGFVDKQLVTYRWGHESENLSVRGSRRHWLDRLWTLEALARDPETREAYPQLSDLLREERMVAYRTALRLGRPSYEGAQRLPLGPYLRYARFRILSKAGKPPALFPILPPATEPRRQGG